MHEKWADIKLPYFKQGDDLHFYLEDTDSVEAALKAHAEAMDEAGAILREVGEIVVGHAVGIEAMTHCITIGGPESVINSLIERGLADECFDPDEEV